jgi:hypothetical protein
MYDAKGIQKQARLAAVRQLRSEATFATMRDDEKLYVYNDETGVFEDYTEHFVKERLDKVLRKRSTLFIIAVLRRGGETPPTL